ncbi:MAG: hypothetical protein ACO23R_14545 [bacterium]
MIGGAGVAGVREQLIVLGGSGRVDVFPVFGVGLDLMAVVLYWYCCCGWGLEANGMEIGAKLAGNWSSFRKMLMLGGLCWLVASQRTSSLYGVLDVRGNYKTYGV